MYLPFAVCMLLLHEPWKFLSFLPVLPGWFTWFAFDRDRASQCISSGLVTAAVVTFLSWLGSRDTNSLFAAGVICAVILLSRLQWPF